MGSSIAVGECTENCICKRVQGDVGIRMAGKGPRVRDADAPEHHMIAWTESVNVRPGAGPYVTEHGGLRRLGACEIFWRGELDVAGLAGEHTDGHAGPFGQRGVVGKVLAAFLGCTAVSVEQRVESEGLRRLHQAEGSPVYGFFDGAVGPNALDRVGHWQHRD